ncbi:Peptide methionine sulfoxide reductase MsrA [Neofusicoccum parvum]|uniref:Peptide methionine sulfoxide reductase MsrA n=1 Tax=Neofusicoccum parvum TaxID=310453 RepID=A0ACB5RPW8_9PEZI|nr:Peptide methionine sulfoxide reductase MsrA [Neofusicoccum parvum]
MTTMSSLFTRFMRPFSSGPLHAVENGANGVASGNYQKATIAAGCFWGVEHTYRKSFSNKGLIDARVGYIGGDTKNPNYRQVCGGDTGHAEGLQITFDPEKVTYRQLIEYLYTIHDPTQLNHQGPDRGTQYRSAIFFHSPEQETIAKDVTERANKEWWSGKIVTQLVPAGEWYDAETYHQLYLDKNPGGYECPTHFIRKLPPLSQPESS